MENELFEQYHCIVTGHDDGTFMIRQIDHSGNEEAVALHLSQLRYLAEVAGLLSTQAKIPAIAAPEVAMLKCRIRKLRDKLLDLAAHHAREDVVNRSPWGADLIGEIDLAWELAEEFVSDMDGELEAAPPMSRNANSSATTNTTVAGLPPCGT